MGMNRRQFSWMIVYGLLLTTFLTFLPDILDFLMGVTDDKWISNFRIVSVSMAASGVAAWIVFRMRGQEGE